MNDMSGLASHQLFLSAQTIFHLLLCHHACYGGKKETRKAEVLVGISMFVDMLAGGHIGSHKTRGRSSRGAHLADQAITYLPDEELPLKRSCIFSIRRQFILRKFISFAWL